MRRTLLATILLTAMAFSAAAECSHANLEYHEMVPFCNGSGNWEYWYCDDCKCYFEDEDCKNESDRDEIFFTDYKGHYWTEWSIEEPGEAQDGYMERWCQSGCGMTEYYTLEKLGQSTDIIKANKVQKTDDGVVIDLTTDAGKTSGVYMKGEEFSGFSEEKSIVFRFDTGSMTADRETLETLSEVVKTKDVERLRLELKVNDADLLNEKQTRAAESMNAKAIMAAELMLNGEAFEADFGGKMKVEFAHETVNPQLCTLYWIREDGTAEKVKAEFDGQICTTEREHFSVYAIVEDTEVKAELPATGDDSSLFLWAGLLTIGLCAFAASRKIRA